MPVAFYMGQEKEFQKISSDTELILVYMGDFTNETDFMFWRFQYLWT